MRCEGNLQGTEIRKHQLQHLEFYVALKKDHDVTLKQLQSAALNLPFGFPMIYTTKHQFKYHLFHIHPMIIPS